jgi:TATA-box binding protein (TBP) (component of TFIID and TFIIIB)
MAQKTIPELMENNPIKVSEVQDRAFVNCCGADWSIMPCNNVLCGSYGTPIDLDRVSDEHGQRKSTSGVPCVYCKTAVPRGNAMVYAAGRIQVIGPESGDRAMLSAHLVSNEFIKKGIPAIPTNFFITSTPTTVKPCQTENREKLVIDLQKFADRPEHERLAKYNLAKIRQVGFSYYDDKLFPGGKILVNIYNNGNFIILGGKPEHKFIVARNIIAIFTYEYIRQMQEAGTPVNPDNIYERLPVVAKSKKKRKRTVDTETTTSKRSKSLESNQTN